MSNNSTNAPSNAITIPILVAFIISTAIFTCLATLLVISIILYRRRKRRRREALLRAKRKPQRNTSISLYPETPPMKTSSKCPPSVPVSPPQYQQSFVTTEQTPLSPNFPEPAETGGGGALTLIYEADGSPRPVEMMGSTTWGKEDQVQSPLLRHPSKLQMITAAITQKRARTDQ
jgi:hypothetical protein